METLSTKAPSLNEELTHGRPSKEAARVGLFVRQHQRIVTLSLGLLSAILLLTAIVIMLVFSVKVNDDDHEMSPEASELIRQLHKLQDDHAAVSRAQEGFQRDLERERASHGHVQQEIESQKAVNDDRQRQIVYLQNEKAEVLKNITDLTGHCGHCLSGWVLLKSSCYLISDVPDMSKRNWPSSRDYCVQRRSDLLVIDNWEEQKIISQSIPRHLNFWIGLSDSSQRGNWVWINNETQQETFWIMGMPNVFDSGRDCAALSAGTNPRTTWFNDRCHLARHNWICEMQPK